MSKYVPPPPYREPPGGYQPPVPQPYSYGYQGPPVQTVYAQQAPHVIVMKAPFSHGVHLFLDVISCGCWIPIHLIAWVFH